MASSPAPGRSGPGPPGGPTPSSCAATWPCARRPASPAASMPSTTPCSSTEKGPPYDPRPHQRRLRSPRRPDGPQPRPRPAPRPGGGGRLHCQRRLLHRLGPVEPPLLPGPGPALELGRRPGGGGGQRRLRGHAAALFRHVAPPDPPARSHGGTTMKTTIREKIDAAMAAWNAMTEQERAAALNAAGSARPVDAMRQLGWDLPADMPPATGGEEVEAGA